MELTKKERLGFIYQLKILEALYPDDADTYSKHRAALEEGYTLHYEWLVEHLYDELSEDDCREVLDVLDMYRAITYALNELPEDDDLRQHHLAKFVGFDGNNETHLMAYARYYVVTLGRYSELTHDDYAYFNSHAPMLGTYRRMLVHWHQVRERFKLNRAQLASLLEA
ncbi:MAG: YfbU family protein [Brevundimonas sp.]|uniref:YfbU family protein n=1 Tax=Brevundimonas sp. TaxID=1871086 RepID=UPI002488CA61|nr:YfbU family protein [Brevundimonas sp.]MDI1325434.1 YfbU family protein [Brevundimonas sp.]